jgi:multiple sugar transport system substrate-binding protein
MRRYQMTQRTQKLISKTAAFGVAGALVLTGLTDAASATTVNKPALQDVTINVAIAYPAPPKAMLAAFTKSTGIKVNYSYIQWDDLQTKIAAAAEAHAYFADVADVDWSKVGEYYETKWFTPLNKYFNVASLPSQYPQIASFIRDGELIGMPSDVSLLVTDVNTKDFAKAGITEVPMKFRRGRADLTAI